MSNPNPITTPTKPNPNPLTTPSSLISPRNTEYRKGNWTLQETLTLISAKRLGDARRSQSKQQQHQQLTLQPPRSSSELRWKWIENYCCAHGCLRSQNQCNEKWDNLLREYKKVSQYENSKKPDQKPYWEMERQERRASVLPPNMPFEIFDPLRDVISTRSSSSNGRRLMAMNVTPVALVAPKMVELEKVMTMAPAEVVAVPTTKTQPQVNVSLEKVIPVAQPSFCAAEMSESSDSEAANAAEPDPKRQKVGDADSSEVQGASILARTLLACEENRDKRHKEVMELQERRLRLESDQTEVNRQGLIGLVSAFNSLSNAIHAFVSHRRNQSNGNAR